MLHYVGPNHPECHEHNAHLRATALSIENIVTSDVIIMDIVGFITVYIYGKTSFALHTRLEIVCYAVNIAKISCADLVPSLNHCILGRPEQIRVTCPSPFQHYSQI